MTMSAAKEEGKFEDSPKSDITHTQMGDQIKFKEPNVPEASSCHSVLSIAQKPKKSILAGSLLQRN